MCTRPIRIRNNSILHDPDAPIYYTVPCGHCPECLKKNRESYELRSYKEYELCKKVWPDSTRYFLTLTYNNDNVPFYVGQDEKRHYCADFSDVQKCLKLLRKYLKCGLRYFAVVEFGEQRGRVHYHLELTTEKNFHESYIYNLVVSKCWCKYVNKQNVGSRGFVHNVAIKKDGSRRKEYNCIRYLTKYLTKYDTKDKFTKSQSLRVRCSLGYGLGPNHENPFSRDDLARGFVFLPYSQTNRYYIPDIYYNCMTASFEELKKNARYVDYVQHIESLIYDRFFSNENSVTSNFQIQGELTDYLHSKRFPLPEYQSIKLDRLIFSFHNIIAQIPNLYLTEFFKDYDEKYDYKQICRDIANRYTEDDLLDCMLYVLPFLDRSRDGYYRSTGFFVSDPSIYADVVFLFNCLTMYIKYNQSINNSLSEKALSEDEKKSNYFNLLYYEQTNLSKAPESSQRKLWTPELRSSSRLRRANERIKVQKYVSTSYCPY